MMSRDTQEKREKDETILDPNFMFVHEKQQ